MTFNSSVSDVLPWKFTPQQREISVYPGETALAFYTATNTSDQDIIGVATYSVTPGQVAPYFSKIQCFCFEEQRLRAGETVDMPVFFYLDPDMLDDFNMRKVTTVTLNYTFFSKFRAPGVVWVLFGWLTMAQRRGMMIMEPSRRPRHRSLGKAVQMYALCRPNVIIEPGTTPLFLISKWENHIKRDVVRMGNSAPACMIDTHSLSHYIHEETRQNHPNRAFIHCTNSDILNLTSALCLEVTYEL